MTETRGNPAILKLEHGARLTPESRRTLEALLTDVRTVAPGEDVIREGERPENVHVVLEGFAIRYKNLPDGGRQILAWLAPGDWCDMHIALLRAMDHNIAALSPCRVAFISRTEIERLTIDGGGPLNRALWWATLVDEGILREWLVGMGRRPADKQIAHLFCELTCRLRAVGLVEDGRFDFPVSQEALADTVGLSAVHVNRVLQQLRGDGLIRLEDKVLTVHDEARLRAFADFNPNYLHLDKRG
jgi:CRP-like cAMP-binding protein